MKRSIICFAVVMLILTTATLTLGADTDFKGSVTGLFGNDSTGWGSYQVTDKMGLSGNYDDRKIRAGVKYDFSDRFWAKAGVFSDTDENITTGYAGINFSLPFGNNLKLNGFYDYNYQGKNWDQYEIAVKIEMYKNHFINAGVRGNTGSGAEIYDYNPDNEPMLFLRGDFNWQFNKFGIQLRPLLLIEGDLLHDYDFTYQINKRTKAILNVSSLYDKEMKYRAGIEFKF